MTEERNQRELNRIRCDELKNGMDIQSMFEELMCAIEFGKDGGSEIENVFEHEDATAFITFNDGSRCRMVVTEMEPKTIDRGGIARSR